jgi:hypothetical protein
MRFMPPDTDENDNGTMARVYNQFDNYSNLLLCSFVLVHHASKGNQSGKAVTDVGAGAGAQSRATDTHLVLRPHQEDDCVVADAVVRSWPPVAPRCLRWQFPLWEPDDTLDPEALRQERPRRREKPEKEVAIWTPERFVREYLGEEPLLRDEILLACTDAMPRRKAVELLRVAESRGIAVRRQDGPSTPVRFARRPR